MNDPEKTQPLNQYAQQSKQELSEKLLEQEVVEELNDQQLKGIQWGALPIDVNTGRAVMPVITHIATGRTEIRPLPHIAMPVDLNTGEHVQPTLIFPDAQSRTSSPVRRNSNAQVRINSPRANSPHQGSTN
jgi:hypothetical protein